MRLGVDATRQSQELSPTLKRDSVHEVARRQADRCVPKPDGIAGHHSEDPDSRRTMALRITDRQGDVIYPGPPIDVGHRRIGRPQPQRRSISEIQDLEPKPSPWREDRACGRESDRATAMGTRRNQSKPRHGSLRSRSPAVVCCQRWSRACK